ncbi:UNVERIFIED_CONTAM: hypothetical protein GTU68_034514 [Idotea baltica]|nr:hypothetical protein [Idotea baltica]
MDILSLKNVSKSYGDSHILSDINLNIKEGEFVAILGFSGSGKSTLMNILTGLETPDGGQALYKDMPITEPSPERGLVFQSYSLMPWLTVSGNVALAATQVERQEVVEYYLERVGLADSMDKAAADMSNGMQQRVGIARAFALSPKLLLLDEPFGMLDSLTRWELQDVLMDVWAKTKVTAICVTHDVDEAVLLSDRVCMMTNGPQAKVGKLMKVDLPRPRTRKALLEHPDYYRYRAEVLQFLEDYEHGDPVDETPTKSKEEAA